MEQLKHDRPRVSCIRHCLLKVTPDSAQFCSAPGPRITFPLLFKRDVSAGHHSNSGGNFWPMKNLEVLKTKAEMNRGNLPTLPGDSQSLTVLEGCCPICYAAGTRRTSGQSAKGME